ncbi:hypothetical protein ACUY2X_12675, partial [Corynebacterium minutissimum]
VGLDGCVGTFIFTPGTPICCGDPLNPSCSTSPRYALQNRKSQQSPFAFAAALAFAFPYYGLTATSNDALFAVSPLTLFAIGTLSSGLMNVELLPELMGVLDEIFGLEKINNERNSSAISGALKADTNYADLRH